MRTPPKCRYIACTSGEGGLRGRGRQTTAFASRPRPLALYRVLDEQGSIASLRLLYARTPHRSTGIDRFAPPTPRNLYLVNAFA